MPKILIVRLSSIGDIILTTPVIRCIKKQIPDAEIYYLTKYQFSDVIYNNPYLSGFYYLQDNVEQVKTQLKNIGFDYVVDLHKNFRTWRIRRNLKGKKISFQKLNVEKWLLTNFKVNRLPHKHIVDRYFESVARMGVINDGEGLDFFISAHDEVDVQEGFPTEFASGYIVFVIGAKHATKQLPTEKVISICKKIDAPVMLVGGTEDKKRGAEIATSAGNHVVSTCGKYTLGQSASVIKQAELVITHDTGLMHIAAALNKRIISVWGNTVPEFGMYPYLPQGSIPFSIVEVKNLKCRPCSKIGYKKCPRSHFKCMNDIDEAEIINLVNEQALMQ
ncbi:MAG TPA: glycosyltransferase family 9 protein [Bacteroidia bacterium]|nr:glycosyltransferase family 9 protein [Bacteroidia bacterium]HNU33967.1 glycosyltransferase family 9 protein [Bacteroidia bacterium]